MKTNPTLTTKQKEVFEFIKTRIQKNIPPTLREIAQHMGFSSTGTVRDYLKALADKGYLKRQSNLSRSIQLLKENSIGTSSGFKIPIIGSIAAGKPSLAYEDIEGYVDTDNLFLGRIQENDVFALRVKGDSMIDAGILNADIAIIKKSAAADNGDIIAALLEDNEVTLKRLKHKNKCFFLEAANKNYPPIYKEFSVIGKLLTVIRKY